MSFQAKFPRDRAELHTCVLMLEDSPYYRYRPEGLTLNDIENVLDDLLRTGLGNIVITTNTDIAYDRKLRVNNRYEHMFCTFHATAYVTSAFMRTIIQREDIPDVGMYFLENYTNYLKHGKQGNSPVITADKVTSRDEEGLYCLSMFFVRHRNLPLTDARMAKDSAEYSLCLRNATQLIFEGLKYNIWMHNPYGLFAKIAYENAGQKLLREHPENTSLGILSNKYLMCVTGDNEIAEEFGIPETCVVTYGNWYYDHFFKSRTVRVHLAPRLREYCYWLALGYEADQIAQIMNVARGNLQDYLRRAFEPFREAGLAFTQDNDIEKLRALTRKYPHEAKQVTFPLFPYPENCPGELFL